jgi:UDP-N-acetylmuramyl pentapeptide synthase
MAFCNYGEFTVAKVGNSLCNYVHFYYAINIDEFEIVSKAVQKGAAGVVFGRNVVCAKDPENYLAP